MVRTAHASALAKASEFVRPAPPTQLPAQTGLPDIPKRLASAEITIPLSPFPKVTALVPIVPPIGVGPGIGKRRQPSAIRQAM